LRAECAAARSSHPPAVSISLPRHLRWIDRRRFNGHGY
jgi:hypothetical protein